MSKTITLSFVALSGIVMFCSSTAMADSVNKLEHEQVGNSSRPDVDPNASKGADPSIVRQEDQQIGNSAQPDVDPNASKGSDPSIVDQEKSQIPH